MSSIRRIQLEAQEDKRRRDELWKTRIPNVLASRLIIRPDETSYVDKVGVYSSTLMRRFTEGVDNATLMADYPGLTREEIQICFDFEMLRMFNLL